MFPGASRSSNLPRIVGKKNFTSSVIYVRPPQDSVRMLVDLYTKIVNQINYYFSTENLVKDVFLRKNMDEDGWVPIKLIAGFKKISMLTDSIQIILEALRSSSVVEVQGEKVRRRNDWSKWILPLSMRYSNSQAAQNPSSIGNIGGN